MTKGDVIVVRPGRGGRRDIGNTQPLRKRSAANKRRATEDRRQEKGDRGATGDRKRGMGDRRQEKGDRSDCRAGPGMVEPPCHSLPISNPPASDSPACNIAAAFRSFPVSCFPSPVA